MLKHEIYFMNSQHELVYWFFPTIKARDEFIKLNPTWINHITWLDRDWIHFAITEKTRQIKSRGKAQNHYDTIEKPDGVHEYAIFYEGERRKNDTGMWYMGHELPERRKVG